MEQAENDVLVRLLERVEVLERANADLEAKVSAMRAHSEVTGFGEGGAGPMLSAVGGC